MEYEEATHASVVGLRSIWRCRSASTANICTLDLDGECRRISAETLQRNAAHFDE